MFRTVIVPVLSVVNKPALVVELINVCAYSSSIHFGTLAWARYHQSGFTVNLYLPFMPEANEVQS
jgi:hypothetical protein